MAYSDSVQRVITTPLEKISLENGDVFKALQNTDKDFTKFGEAYFSSVSYKKIKAWKLHTKANLNLIVPVGRVKFVFFDQFIKYGSRTEVIGVENYKRIFIPSNIWFGFSGLDEGTNLILSISDLPHEQNEVMRRNLDQIAYEW